MKSCWFTPALLWVEFCGNQRAVFQFETFTSKENIASRGIMKKHQLLNFICVLRTRAATIKLYILKRSVLQYACFTIEDLLQWNNNYSWIVCFFLPDFYHTQNFFVANVSTYFSVPCRITSLAATFQTISLKMERLKQAMLSILISTLPFCFEANRHTCCGNDRIAQKQVVSEIRTYTSGYKSSVVTPGLFWRPRRTARQIFWTMIFPFHKQYSWVIF